MSTNRSPGRRRKNADAERRRRLRRRLEHEGWSPDLIDIAITDLSHRQAAQRAAEQAGLDAWRRRHPSLPEPTIRLVLAELRRNRTGAQA